LDAKARQDLIISSQSFIGKHHSQSFQPLRIHKMNTPAGTIPSALFGSSSAPLNLGAVNGRYQTMHLTKDGRYVVVCRCCRNRGGSPFLPSTPFSVSTACTPKDQVMVDADATHDSPEIRCLCFELERSLSMKDAPRRSARLSKASKTFLEWSESSRNRK
jgi:hypothetical protein